MSEVSLTSKLPSPNPDTRDPNPNGRAFSAGGLWVFGRQEHLRVQENDLRNARGLWRSEGWHDTGLTVRVGLRR